MKMLSKLDALKPKQLLKITKHFTLLLLEENYFLTTHKAKLLHLISKD